MKISSTLNSSLHSITPAQTTSTLST